MGRIHGLVLGGLDALMLGADNQWLEVLPGCCSFLRRLLWGPLPLARST